MNSIPAPRAPWRRLAAIPALAAATMFIAACGGGTSSTSPNNGTEQNAGPRPQATVALGQAPTSLDPAVTVTGFDRVILGLVGGLLVETGPNGNTVPALAEKFQMSADNRSATATLRPGLKFSDGTALTADDVVATWKRNLSKKDSVLASIVSRVKSVTAKDDRTVVFQFKAPYASFAQVPLAYYVGAVYPSEGLAKGDKFFEQPVSAGPYKIAQPWNGREIVLEANPNYALGKPKIQTLHLTTIEDGNAALSQLQTGQIDVAYDLPPNLVSRLGNAGPVKAIPRQAYGFYDLRMNNKTGPLANADLRKAISLAIDRKQLVNVVWQGKTSPAAGFWPPTMKGHETASTTRDVVQAKQLLAGTDCAQGCELTYSYSDQDFPFAGQLALLIRDQLKQIGVSVKLRKMDRAALVDALRKGDYQLMNGGIFSPMDVPDRLAGLALQSDGGLNAEFSGYASKKMDTLIQQANQNAGSTRTQAMSQIDARFHADQPYAVLATWVYMTASRLPESLIKTDAGGRIVVARDAVR
jgi:peptide/nickel transport system substrate-binding protein